MSNWIKLSKKEQQSYHVQSLVRLADAINCGLPTRLHQKPTINKIHEYGLDGFAMIVHNVLQQKIHTDNGKDYSLRDLIDREYDRWFDIHKNELHVFRTQLSGGWYVWKDPNHAIIKVFFGKGRIIWKRIDTESLAGLLLRSMRRCSENKGNSHLRNTYTKSDLIESRDAVGVCVTITDTDLLCGGINEFIEDFHFHGDPPVKLTFFHSYENAEGNRCVVFVLEWEKKWFYEKMNPNKKTPPSSFSTIESRIERLEHNVEQILETLQ